MVPVLFARKDSIYKTLGCDVYDIDRDARNFVGGSAAIYHPPCRAWGQLSHFAKPREDEKGLAIWSINMIRQHGGVLEHPRASKLWGSMRLPKPGSLDKFGGFSVCIDQFCWGHKARKRSLLYIVGIKPSQLPPIPIRLDAVEFTVASKIKKKSGRLVKKEITKKEREATPEEFAKWLIKLAEIIQQQKSK